MGVFYSDYEKESDKIRKDIEKCFEEAQEAGWIIAIIPGFGIIYEPKEKELFDV